MTLQFGLSPSYVLDEIQTYEISALMKYSYYRHKEDWEQARLISYLIAQVNSNKKLKVTDIVKFPWESETDKDDTYISEEDIKMLSEKAKQYEQMLAAESAQ